MDGVTIDYDPRNVDYYKEGTTGYVTDLGPGKLLGYFLDPRVGHLGTPDNPGPVPEIDSKIVTDHRNIPGGTKRVLKNDLFFLINFHGSIVKDLNRNESKLLNDNVYYITSAKPQYCALTNDSFDNFIYNYFNTNGASGAKLLYGRNFLEELKDTYIEGHAGISKTTYDYYEQDVSHLSIDRRRLNHDWSYSLVDPMDFKGLYEINNDYGNSLRLLLNKSNGRFEGDEDYRYLADESNINLSDIIYRIKELNPRSNIYIFITSCLFDSSVKIDPQGNFITGEAYTHVPRGLTSVSPFHAASNIARAKRKFTPQRPQQKGVIDYCRDFGECLFGQTPSNDRKILDYGRDMRRGGKKKSIKKKKTKRKSRRKTKRLNKRKK